MQCNQTLAMKMSQVTENSTNVRACQNTSRTQKTPQTPEG